MKMKKRLEETWCREKRNKRTKERGGGGGD